MRLEDNFSFILNFSLDFDNLYNIYLDHANRGAAG